ncbi:MAG: hypothetical protein ACRDCC_08355 [Culicoidibacterales bacterium]
MSYQFEYIDVETRINAAKREITPHTILDILIEDPKVEVVYEAIKNPNLSLDSQMKLIMSDNFQIMQTELVNRIAQAIDNQEELDTIPIWFCENIISMESHKENIPQASYTVTKFGSLRVDFTKEKELYEFCNVDEATVKEANQTQER